MALFGKQLASIFESSTTSGELIRRLREGSGYVEGEGWKILTYEEVRQFQTWEKNMSGKSAIEALLNPPNPNGAAIVFEEAALWLLARSNTPKGKEFAKRLVETFIAVRNGYFVPAEEMKRIEARHKLTETETKFAAIVFDRDVDRKGIAEIKALGDKTLFGGKDTAQMKKEYGLKAYQPLADRLSTVVIKAKDLAMEITSVNTEIKDLKGKESIRQEHIENNQTVRSSLVSRGIKPEEEPPQEDIKKIERKYNKTMKLRGGMKEITSGLRKASSKKKSDNSL